MEDELNLDELEVQTEEKLKVKNRFQQLSEKVSLTSKERDEARAQAEAEAQAKLEIEKERDFYKDFSVNISKYPQASEYQSKILEKVKAGYSTEDAMVAVLNKEGKLINTNTTNNAETPQIEGGSAPTIQEGTKSINDMSPEEKLAILSQAGDLEAALRGK